MLDAEMRCDGAASSYRIVATKNIAKDQVIGVDCDVLRTSSEFDDHHSEWIDIFIVLKLTMPY